MWDFFGRQLRRIHPRFLCPKIKLFFSFSEKFTFSCRLIWKLCRLKRDLKEEKKRRERRGDRLPKPNFWREKFYKRVFIWREKGNLLWTFCFSSSFSQVHGQIEKAGALTRKELLNFGYFRLRRHFLSEAICHWLQKEMKRTTQFRLVSST